LFGCHSTDGMQHGRTHPVHHRYESADLG
jgi:hypothetical protein